MAGTPSAFAAGGGGTVVARCKDGIGSAAAGGGGGGTVGAARVAVLLAVLLASWQAASSLRALTQTSAADFGSDARCAGGELQPLDKGLDFSLTGAQRPRLTHGPAGIVVEARDVAHPGRCGDHHRAPVTSHLVFATVGASGLILDRAKRLAIAQADRIEVVGQFGALPAGQAQIFGRLPGSLNQSVGLSARADHHLLSIDAVLDPAIHAAQCPRAARGSPWHRRVRTPLPIGC